MKPENECACDKCVVACELQPGWFAPGEAEIAAAYLNVPFEEFKKKFLVIDHCDNPFVGDAPYAYAPRKIGVDKPEDEIRTGQTQRQAGQCVFLKDKRCSIHEVKPYECAMIKACDYKYGIRDDLETRWIKAGAPLGMRPESNEEFNPYSLLRPPSIIIEEIFK